MSSEFGALGSSASLTAGGLLRLARERQGLHIAALAASIKVAPRKLDALEHDRYEELSGIIFTRALAQSVCRALRIDAKPVLALLPQPEAIELDPVRGTLNTPFRDKPSRDEPGLLAMAQRSLVWAGVALLLAAVATYFLPLSFFKSTVTSASTTTAPLAAEVNIERPLVMPVANPAGAAPASVSAPTASVLPAPDASAMAALAAPLSASPGVMASGTTSLLLLSTTESSWVEVRDGKGNVLLSRIVMPSESVALDGALPLRLVIGNAGVTQVQFRGKAVDVAANTRDNVARLELN